MVSSSANSGSRMSGERSSSFWRDVSRVPRSPWRRSAIGIGSSYWIVDEIEAAGCLPKLVHACKAKLMMGEINKTDSARRPVWIPPGELRDQRDLPRTRMVLVRQRTQLGVRSEHQVDPARRPPRITFDAADAFELLRLR